MSHLTLINGSTHNIKRVLVKKHASAASDGCSLLSMLKENHFMNKYMCEGGAEGQIKGGEWSSMNTECTESK